MIDSNLSSSAARATGSRWLHRLAGGALVLAALCFVANLLHHASALWIWDDAYMFLRYSDHWLAGHGLSWNVQDGPCYGLTTPLYLVFVVPLRLLFADNDHLPVALASLCGTVLFLLFVVRWVFRSFADSSYRLAAGVVAAYVLLVVNRLGFHSATGMDTTVALAFLMVWFSAYARAVHTGGVERTARVFLVGGFGGLAFWVRPDLLLFTVGVPAVHALFARGSRRRTTLFLAITTLLVVGAQSFIAARYFGSALPLPFFTKSPGFYGEEMARQYADSGARRAAAFALAYAAPLLGILLTALLRPLQWWRALSAAERGFLSCGIGFFVYYRFFVLHIMGGHERFLLPLLVPMVVVGARSASVWVEWARGGSRPDREHEEATAPRISTSPLAALLATVALLAMIGHSVWIGRQQSVKFWIERHRGTAFQYPGSDRPSARPARGDGSTEVGSGAVALFALDDYRHFPDDLVIAASDVGYLGVCTPNKRLIDLAALHDTDFARNGISVDRVLKDDQPDVLFLPHRFYESRAKILQHPRFAEDYALLRRSPDFPYWPTALRRDSPYYERFLALAQGGD